MTISTAPRRAFADRVQTRSLGTGKAMYLPTPVRDVVSFRGSFLSYPDFATGEELVQDLAVALLDKGTQKRDRFALADILEYRGAQLRFYSDGLRVGFSGRALRQDLPEVLSVLQEQLCLPAFAAEEVEKGKARLAAGLQRSLEQTGAQAGAALSRSLLDPAHPGYIAPFEEEWARIAALTPANVAQYHAQHFGGRGLLCCVVGDFDPEAVHLQLESLFGGWPEQAGRGAFGDTLTHTPPQRHEIEMADKQNADVMLGHVLPLRRDHPDYLALYIANYILGGNFSARLMTVVRDEMGLTYGINARLMDMSVVHDGYWRIGVTLSAGNIEAGIEATLGEVRRLAEFGVTEAELAEKKETITGAFKVGLATTNDLGGALLHNAERGFDTTYLDDFPQKIQALTLTEVNDAIAQYIHPDALHTAIAGKL